MIQRRMLLSPDPAPPVNSGEPENTMASREPCLCSFGRTGSNLAIMCWRKRREPSFTLGSPAPKRPCEAPLLMLAPDLALLALPIDAEGRVGEEVVEGAAREPVLDEAVAEAHVVAAAVVVHLLHQHVGGGGGVGALVVVLAVDVEPGPPGGGRAASSALPPASRRCRRRGRGGCAPRRGWRAARRRR